ncbi:MAG: PLP-dependent aminotransferase family protein [Gemmatimonadetes bacterium]|jgi:2-aminoadipate transaminase|nr:PLP-dependent aminotransferase family protein [Gemmatimonadota bacterium]MBT4608492.1 PLP-dependent aminotransferase family protein [Gemmatimonadota bacterium]MBT5057080.1 PLP-dependent aminotransferase family protein [Gemmatimonadota bacterium]MBT5144647.1 PLP-dependent aminotransferase family protein [Gemmatimonadota bacterium]MBT5587392.1 PLP-dependent aminotransferase family protein [Gemmatimonadota bacterium]
MNPEYDFGSGCTNPDTFPVEKLAAAAAAGIREVGVDFTRYPGDLGHLGMREMLARRESEREGVQVDPDHMVLTNGSMQGVTLTAEAFLVDGEENVIITEELTYSGTIGAYRRLGVRMAGVHVDEQGMCIDHLEETLKDLQRAGTTPRFIYTLPTYQNPTGSVMPRSRRLQLLDVAHRFGVPIVEDNCYADVHFEGAKEPALYALDDTDHPHIYLCSLSKILGPGVRLGYVYARQPMLQKVLDRRYDGGNSLLTASVLASFFGDGLWDHVEQMNGPLKQKRDAVFAGLEQNVKDICTWSHPVGGLFIWVHLPHDIDHSRLRQLADAARVRYAAGSAFHIDGLALPNLRLAFGYPPLEAIHEGVPILADCIRQACGASDRGERTAAG